MCTYVEAAVNGGMLTEAFLGIRRGITIRADGTGKQVHGHYEMYFDPTQTAFHGDQTPSGAKVDLTEEYGMCFEIPQHTIIEPPSYLAYKDSTGYLHKRGLKKSGDWRPYCWGPAHERGFKCIYYNFCKRCLAFNPQEKNCNI